MKDSAMKLKINNRSRNRSYFRYGNKQSTSRWHFCEVTNHTWHRLGMRSGPVPGIWGPGRRKQRTRRTWAQRHQGGRLDRAFRQQWRTEFRSNNNRTVKIEDSKSDMIQKYLKKFFSCWCVKNKLEASHNMQRSCCWDWFISGQMSLASLPSGQCTLLSERLLLLN